MTDDLGQHVEVLGEITANLDAYLERRAAELAAPLITKADAEASESVQEARFEATRQAALVHELRRRIESLERSFDAVNWRLRDGGYAPGLPGVHTVIGRLKRAEAERDKLRTVVAEYENAITWHTSCRDCASLLDASYGSDMRAREAEAERDRLRATVERVRKASEEMRGFCSPHGVARWYADHIDAALAEPDQPAQQGDADGS